MDRARKYVLIGSVLCLLGFAMSILGTTAGLTAWASTPPAPTPSPSQPWLTMDYDYNADHVRWCWVIPMLSMYIPLSFLYQQFFLGRWPNPQSPACTKWTFELCLWVGAIVWMNWILYRPFATLFSTQDAMEHWRALISLSSNTTISVLGVSILGSRFLIRSWNAVQPTRESITGRQS
jgi:hypothetical protein